MGMCSQQEADKIVERVKRIVLHFGPKHEQLAQVRRWYSIFHDKPEHFAMTVLEHEVKRLERIMESGLAENHPLG